MSGRNSPEQRRWIKAVKVADKKCVFCGSTENLQAHHVLKWESFPEHRNEIGNGLTVCVTCHLRIHTKGGVYGRSRLRGDFKLLEGGGDD